MGVEERNCKEVNYAVGKGCSSNSLYTEYGKRKYLQILQVPLLVREEEKSFVLGKTCLRHEWINSFVTFRQYVCYNDKKTEPQ